MASGKNAQLDLEAGIDWVTTSQAPPPKQTPEFLAHGFAHPATGGPLLSGYLSMIDMRKKSVLIPFSVKLRLYSAIPLAQGRADARKGSSLEKHQGLA